MTVNAELESEYLLVFRPAIFSRCRRFFVCLFVCLFFFNISFFMWKLPVKKKQKLKKT